MGRYARSELIGECSTGGVRSTACMDHAASCREAAGPRAKRSCAGAFPLAWAAVHLQKQPGKWQM